MESHLALARKLKTLARAKTGNLPKREFEFAKGQIFLESHFVPLARKPKTLARVKFPFGQISRFRFKFPFRQISRFRFKFPFIRCRKLHNTSASLSQKPFQKKCPFANSTRASIKSLRQR